MINSIYEPMFESLLRKQEVLIPEEHVNKHSMRIQWTKFRDAQFGADWLIGQVLEFEYIDDGKHLTRVFLRKSKRRAAIPFTVLTSEIPHADTPIRNNMESDQTCEGAADP